MGRKKRGDVEEYNPDKLLRRADTMQYWMQQMDFPKPGTDNYKKLRIIDKMCIGLIDKAMDGQAAAFNAAMENAFGKNTEGADSSVRSTQSAGARFNIPKTVSELNAQVDLEDSIKEAENE